MSPYVRVCMLSLPRDLPFPPIATRPLKSYLLGQWAHVLRVDVWGSSASLLICHYP